MDRCYEIWEETRAFRWSHERSEAGGGVGWMCGLVLWAKPAPGFFVTFVSLFFTSVWLFLLIVGFLLPIHASSY